MRSAKSVYGYLMAILLIFIFMIELAFEKFTVAILPMLLLVVLMIILAIWDVMKYHRK